MSAIQTGPNIQQPTITKGSSSLALADLKPAVLFGDPTLTVNERVQLISVFADKQKFDLANKKA